MPTTSDPPPDPIPDPTPQDPRPSPPPVPDPQPAQLVAVLCRAGVAIAGGFATPALYAASVAFYNSRTTTG